MRQYLEKREQERREMEEYYHTPANLRLKYAALTAIAAAIILILIPIFWMDSLSSGLQLFMRGCAGLFGLAFIVLVAILVYRVNTAYWRHRKAPPNNQ